MFVQTMLLLSYGHLFLSDNFGDGYHRSMESGAAGTAPVFIGGGLPFGDCCQPLTNSSMEQYGSASAFEFP